MRWYEGKLPDAAKKYSIEWLSSFPYNASDLFMMLQVCADESYQLNDGDKKVVAIGGWLASPEQFKGFCHYWNAVLKAYDAPYFHFKEYADKDHKYHDTTPYDGWPDLKRENFLYDLALVACEVGIPIGACMAPEKDGDSKFELISVAYSTFFSGVLGLVTNKFEAGSTVDFVFDENTDQMWFGIIQAHLNGFKGCGAPFGNWTAADDKSFAPLQAADLYVYAMKQNAERFYYENNNQPGRPRLLDLILEKKRPDYDNWTFQWENWDGLMREVIKHFREWSKTNNSKDYRPLIHCPLLQKNESANTI